MGTKTNPAQRLHDIFVRANDLSSKHKTISGVLAELFNIDEDNDVAIWRHLIMVDDLFEQIEGCFRKIHVASHPYTQYFPKIRKMLLSMHLPNPPKNNLTNALGPHIIDALYTASARIGENYSEFALEDKDLAILDKKLDELFGLVKDGTFDPMLRELSLEIIESLRHAISNYQIRGIEAFKEALEQSLGKLVLYMQSNGKDQAPPNSQIRRLWGIIVTVEGFVARASNYVPLLTEHLPPLLGS